MSNSFAKRPEFLTEEVSIINYDPKINLKDIRNELFCILDIPQIISWINAKNKKIGLVEVE